MDGETFARVGLGALLMLGSAALAVLFCGGLNAVMDEEEIKADLAADDRRERLRQQQVGFRRDAR